MTKKIYISGMHSGQNPCSGVGIARCIKKAFPELTLVGVDHWQGSSGLHDNSIDEVHLLPQWKQMEDDHHAKHVLKILNDENLWISALDMEVHWLSEKVGPHSNLLAPGGPAIELTAKPDVKALKASDFLVPDYISASLPDSEIHSFLRQNSWQCWLKSPYHDAKRISSWSSFERARESMSRHWKTSRLFLQRHVVGNEETIAFAAHKGKLLSAVHLQKRQLTPEGKTWAGRVDSVDPGFFNLFTEIVNGLEWSGGGEIEYVIDPDGQKWLIECNPRFPAWIYGAALAGRNLPARLVAEAWNLPILEKLSPYPFFTRVVQEIPARQTVGIPLPADAGAFTWNVDGKKGKGGPLLGTTLPNPNSDSKTEKEEDEKFLAALEPEVVAPLYQRDVSRVCEEFAASPSKESPLRIHLEEWSKIRFETLSRALKACSRTKPVVRVGFSLKTSPTDDFLRKAKASGFLAECISQKEIHRALEFGFAKDEIILNGPGKFWPMTQSPITGLHLLFCDSVEEFDRVIATHGSRAAQGIGFRVRLPTLNSRFGNAVDNFHNFQKIVTSVRRTKGVAELGFHFHMPSWSIGVQRWSKALECLLVWCRTIQELSGVPVRHIDLGGGFFPTDLDRLAFPEIQRMVGQSLPEVKSVFIEPGRSLTQDSEVLISRVLDIRKSQDGILSEAVVDACIAELPLAGSYSHRIFYRQKGPEKPCRLLKKGRVRILGRICMEDDILSSGLELPDATDIGDFIIFGDAGGYERSMSYVFGRG